MEIPLQNPSQLNDLLTNNQVKNHSLEWQQPFEIHFNFATPKKVNPNYKYLIKELKVAYKALKNQKNKY